MVKDQGGDKITHGAKEEGKPQGGSPPVRGRLGGGLGGKGNMREGGRKEQLSRGSGFKD